MFLELFPHLSALLIEEVERQPGRVVFRTRVRAATAVCSCGESSARVHGRYIRRLRDVAAGGLGVVIELRVRRFRCENARCPAVTFAEQIAGLTTPHSRYTPLLRGMLTQIGLALAGRAGARVAAAVGISVGRDTLLRMVRAVPEPDIGEVEVLGVDDFAFRKGRHYGTLLIDMATHRPLHLYDGREGQDLADWLRGHPEVKVICRDRSSGYAEGARVGAPQAQQVADRYHLWANLGQAVEKSANAHRSRLAEPAPADAAEQLEEEPAVVQSPNELKIVTRLREQHAAAHKLWEQGMSKAAIGRKLDLHQATIRKLINARSADDVVAKSLQRAHIVDPYVGYLHRRWNEGVRNAAQLHREIQQLGYPGGELAVQRHLRRFRTGRGHAPAPGPKPPSVREVTSWIMTHPEHLRDEDADRLHRLRERNAELDRLTSHVRKFAVMMTGRHGDRLENWIADAEQDTLVPLASFARNLRRDFDAVRNGLSLPYSSGAVEGNVNRLKMLKRQMFGRAGLDLLRKRVLFAR
ncbi:ISL3 family transposase [Streptomyces sp. NPDC005227]|uniref:ISL3 family transposase n=1 Tax=unclassified Streptomyces TaxID=2593676 RepID=UPI0036B3B782